MMIRKLDTTGFNNRPYQVKSDGVTIWVNHQRGCYARFSRAGIEISVQDFNKPIIDSQLTPNAEDWQRFKTLLGDCFGFEIDDTWCPGWVSATIRYGKRNYNFPMPEVWNGVGR